MTTVVISQPMYFPWPGFMAQMALADVMIWLDDAQFSKGSFTNRVQIMTPSGRKWMTIPLRDKGSFSAIRDLHAATPDWCESHLGQLSQAFLEHRHRQKAIEIFRQTVKNVRLVDLIISSAEIMAREMGITPARILRSSQMNVPGQSWQRVRDMVLSVGGTRYVTGHGALNYLDHEAFEARGITVDYMDYHPKPWPQPHNAFTPYVSALDLLAALPPNEASAHLAPATLPWRVFKASQTSPQ